MCLRVCSLAILAVFFATDLRAQSEPRITVLTAGGDRLFDEVKLYFGLTTDAEQKQREHFDKYLADFMIGIDRKRPMRVDLIVAGEVVRQRPGFPITSQQEFLRNLDLFGIKSRKLGTNFYRLTGAYEGYLRVVEENKIAYAIIGEERDDVPARGFFPLDAAVAPYLADDKITLSHDLLATLENLDDKNVDARRKSYGSVKKELMATVSRMEGESAENFELRKGLLSLQIDELGRYYTDSKMLQIGWRANGIEKRGKVSLSLVPTPNTSLAGTIEQTGQLVSHFGAVVPHDDAIALGSILLPLDNDQRKNYQEVVKLVKKRIDSEIDELTTETAEQKQARKQMVQIFTDGIHNGLKTDSIDGFLHVWPNASGKHTAVGGLYSSQAGEVVKVLQQLPIASPGRNVGFDLDKVGDVAIHSFDLSDENKAIMEDFFGSLTIYVGVGPNSVWYAVGENALDSLKAKIQQVVDASDLQPTGIVFSVRVNAGPFLAWEQRHAKPKDEKAKETMPLRQFAVEALAPGEDLLQVELKKSAAGVEGSTNLDQGYLRFVGKILARFSKETLAP